MLSVERCDKMNIFFGIFLLAYAAIHGFNTVHAAIVNKSYGNFFTVLRVTIFSTALYFGLKLLGVV